LIPLVLYEGGHDVTDSSWDSRRYGRLGVTVVWYPAASTALAQLPRYRTRTARDGLPFFRARSS
jgi:hypothetical protein